MTYKFKRNEDVMKNDLMRELIPTNVTKKNKQKII